MNRRPRTSSDWIELEGVKPDFVASSPFRRAMLVFLLGIALLAPALSLRSERSPSTAARSGAALFQPSTSTSTSSSQPSTSTTSNSTLHAPSDVLVQVANGGHVQGGAASTTAVVAGLGFRTEPAVNASRIVPNTVVYFAPGFRADAVALATALTGTLGLHPSVLPVQPSVPVSPPASTDVVIVLGTDTSL